MFIFLAYVSLALIQLYRRHQRRMLYSAAMMRAFRSGSVLVQRGKHMQHGSVGALFNSSLLSCSRSYKETQLLSDEHLAVSSVSPKQQVDLGEWTSYLDLQPAQTNSNSVVALLEAGPPDPSQNTPSQVPLASRVHVLKHGCPLAWKAGNPFGIILLCSCEDFVILSDALGQGQLTLNEDLQLYRMLTISTVGKPKSLRRPKSEEMAPTVDRDNLKTRRANTDPVRFSSADNSLPVFDGFGSQTAKTCGTGFKSNSPAKVKMELDHCVVRHEGGLCSAVSGPQQVNIESEVKGNKRQAASEVPANTVCNNSISLPAGSPEVTRNGSTVVAQGNSAILAESPVIQISFDLTKDQENNTQALSLDSSDELDLRSTEANGRSRNLDSHGPENSVSQSSNDASNRNAPLTQNSNGCEEYSEMPVESQSVFATESEQGSKLEGSSTEKKEDMKLSVCENAVPVSHKDLNATGSVASRLSQDVKTDTKSKATSGGFQQVSSKHPDMTTSVNGSVSSVNGSGDAAPSLQKSEPSKEARTGSPAVTTSQRSSGEEEKSLPSESSQSARNGSHDADGKSGGQTGCKPPNVVVYCGKKDSARKFEIVKDGLEQCLNTSAYTVYILPHEEVMTLPWEDNSAVLIISHDYLHDNIGKKFANFLLNGGKVISFGSSLEAEFLVRKETKGRAAIAKFNLQKWKDVSAIQGRYHYVPGSLKKGNSSMDTLVVDPTNSQPLVVRLTLSGEHGNGKAIFSQLFLERDPSEAAADSKTFSRLKQSSQQRLEVLRYMLSLLDLDTSVAPAMSLTPCYLLVQDQALRKSFLDSLAGRMKQDTIRSRSLSLKFVSAKPGSSAPAATNDTLPIVTDIPAGSFKGLRDAGRLQYFDPEVYWRYLTASVLGHLVMYTEVIPTTMTVFEGIQFSLPEDVGVIAVAGRQTSGKGRGGNQWLSPAGCAMFTLPLRLPVESHLGQHVSFLQHVVSLSVVHSIRTMPGYQDLDLRLKWPNDIYYGNTTKLGGVLVNSTIIGKTMHATAGCGINVSNSLPTVCVNSIIQEHNALKGSNLRTLTTSEVVARTVSTLETLLAEFQNKGHQGFCQLYYKYWLHSGAHVKVESEGNAEVDIVGLDDFGYLHVVNKQGQTFSVQPDGNSFDMLRNLISVKRD